MPDPPHLSDVAVRFEAAAPGLAEQVTAILFERQMAIDENVSSRNARPRSETEARSHALLDKVRRFFAL